jgi:hypothetical protein
MGIQSHNIQVNLDINHSFSIYSGFRYSSNKYAGKAIITIIIAHKMDGINKSFLRKTIVKHDNNIPISTDNTELIWKIQNKIQETVNGIKNHNIKFLIAFFTIIFSFLKSLSVSFLKTNLYINIGIII